MVDQALRLAEVEGEVVMIGWNAQPQISSAAALDRQTLPLAGSQVHLLRALVPQKKTVTVTKTSLSGSVAERIIVLRFDLVTSRTALQRIGVSGGQTTLQASTIFYNATGRPIDPRGNSRLNARFDLIDGLGNVVATTAGRAAPNQPALEATFNVPSAGDGLYEVVCQTTDSSSGTPFCATERRVIDLAAMPVVAQVRAATAVQVSAGRPGEEIRVRVDIDAIGPLETARRAFLDEIVATPPVVAVHTPGRHVMDSRHRADTFVRRAASHDGSRATFELGFLTADAAGEYVVEVQAGSAAGVSYPSATAAARCVDDDALQLNIVENTTSGPQLLFDSAQTWCRPATAGTASS